MRFTVEWIGNMVFITDETGQVWNAWNKDELTTKKLSNAIKKLQSYHTERIVIDCPISICGE